MPWVRFADDYLTNAKVARLSALARLLDMSAIIYSARELRDGQLTPLDVKLVAGFASVPRWSLAAAELVQAGRWVPTREGGFRIHDYFEYQPSREQVLAEREAARKRMAKRRNSGRSSSERSGEQSPNVRPEFGRSSPTPYPVNSYSVSSELNPAAPAAVDPGAHAPARSPAHEVDPKLLAEHQLRIARERAAAAAAPGSSIKD